MTIKTHGRMFTDNTVGITQLDITDGTANQALVTDGQGVMRFATVGAGGSVGSSVFVEDIRTGDGSTVTFTLSTAAPYEESILVFIDGVAQPTSSFTLPSTTSLTFSPAPGNGAAIRICHLGIASSVADNSITGAKIAMGGDTPGDILFYNGTDYQRLTIGTALQILRTNAAVNAPEWVDATTASLPATGADGNVLTSDGSNWSSERATGGVGGELVSIQTFTGVGSQGSTLAVRGTAQTWTRPTGVTRIEVHLVGQGGNTTNPDGNGNGGPGGAGGYCVGIYDVTNTATATVTIPVAWDGSGVTPGVQNTTFPSIFAIAGGTTMTASPGGFGTSTAASGGNAVGGALNFAGDAGVAAHAHGAHSHFSGVNGDGAKLASGNLGNNGYAGAVGYCYIKEYSDVSASLVGDKMVSHQLLTTEGTTTWTRPANITKIRVWVTGSGGRSQVYSSDGNPRTSAGGGSGATAMSILDVTNITSAPVIIGDNAATTTAARNCSFNTTIIGGGGLDGGSANNQGANGVPGGGGTATGGQVNLVGRSGDGPGVGGGSAGHPGVGGQAPGLLNSQFGAGAGGMTNTGGPFTSTGSSGCVFIEEYIDASLVSGGSLVPAGAVNAYAGATAPAGWLLCYGQAISRTTYSTLFTAIGTTYGVGDGSTTFALPDMRGRAVAGQDDMGGTSANRLTTPINGDTLGAVGGIEASSHTHGRGASGVGFNPDDSGNLISATGVSTIQPTIILNYIIKT